MPNKVENSDWEEISQDDGYIYLGDFGNNTGDRTDLHILRVEKSSLKSGKPSIDTIWYTYSDQYDIGNAAYIKKEIALATTMAPNEVAG